MAKEGVSRFTELRDQEIYEKRVRGATLKTLAEEFDISLSRVSDICKEQRAGLPERSREDLIRASIERLEFLREKVIELAEMPGAPVTVGQHGDILREPDTDEVVRDYSLRIKAIDQAHKLGQTFDKLFGLAAPTAANVEVKASIQYEIVGVDPEALT